MVARTRDAFHVPGIGIGIVRDGKIVFAKGYGLRSIDKTSGAVDSRTLFAIGSNTKEFTATALAILVDEGKLDWNDRVIDHMPEFRVADPWITREFRVSDLLTHHSGMGLGAGDLMLFSDSLYTRPEVVAGLRYMPFTGEFRTSYAYNNLLYVVAGQLVETISGQRWEDFVQSRIIDAAGLPACFSSPPKPGTADVALGHDEVDGNVVARKFHPMPAMAPAGGVWCSVDGMNRWVQTLLNGGRTAEGRTVFSRAQRDVLWSPHALLPLADTAAMTHSHFRAYGYGWFMEDFFGTKRIWHTGTVSGMVSYVSLLPERNAGIVVLTNQDNHNATYSIATTLSAAIAGGPAIDWVGHWKAEETAKDAARAQEARTNGPGSPARPFVALKPSQMQDYVGHYHDDWRGDIEVSMTDGHLRMRFGKADGLSGNLFALPHDLFVVRWDDRAADGEDDCYVQFHRDVTGQVTDINMQVIGSDFSFDVQDLHPRRVRTP